jgi:hypothetical protein
MKVIITKFPGYIYNYGYYNSCGDFVCHREDGPASDNGNLKMWFYHGAAHREDGPAQEFADGQKEWWYKGEYAAGIDSQGKFEKWIAYKNF